jgi:hypothetical protein
MALYAPANPPPPAFDAWQVTMERAKCMAVGSVPKRLH